MAGPDFVRSGTRVQSASAATLTPTKPTVDGAGGVMLAVLSTKNNAAHATATAGWTRVGAQQNSGASFTASLWVAAEGAAAPVFTWTGAVACEAQISYYSDPGNTTDVTIAASSVSSGTTNPHTSTAIVTTRNNALAVYVDVAAANTAIATPAGWVENTDNGSATDVGRTAFGSKAVAVSGTSSGAISITGAAAVWVQWQVELRGSAAGAALEESKLEVGAFIEPLSGLAVGKEEVGAFIVPNDGYTLGKIEVGAWLYQPLSLDYSKLEVGAFIEPQGGFSSTKFEVGAWLGLTVVSTRKRAAQIIA